MYLTFQKMVVASHEPADGQARPLKLCTLSTKHDHVADGNVGLSTQITMIAACHDFKGGSSRGAVSQPGECWSSQVACAPGASYVELGRA